MSQVDVLSYTMTNPQVLQDLYEEFRKIDERLGIECDVRYIVSAFAGENSGSRAIVFSYPDGVHAWDVQAKRSADPEYQKLGQKLLEAGFAQVSRSLMSDITPA